MARTSLIRYSWDFLKGAGGASAWAAAAISDPLKWVQAAGFMSGVHWPIEPWQRQAIFATIAFLWMFVWYVRIRRRYESRRPRKGDIPLHQAVRYIARDSKWATSQTPEYDENWISNVSRALTSALAEGRIHAWGRLRKPMEMARENTSLIPVKDLQHIDWELNKMAHGIPPSRIKNLDGPNEYYRVMLNREEVEKEWPQRSIWARLRRKSPVERTGDYGPRFAEQDARYDWAPHMAIVAESNDHAIFREVFPE